MVREDLEKSTKAQLVEQAEGLGIETTGMNKSQVIEAILALEEPNQDLVEENQEIVSGESEAEESEKELIELEEEPKVVKSSKVASKEEIEVRVKIRSAMQIELAKRASRVKNGVANVVKESGLAGSLQAELAKRASRFGASVKVTDKKTALAEEVRLRTIKSKK